MKQILVALLACTLLFAACTKTSNENQLNTNAVDNTKSTQLQTPQQINAIIKEALNIKGEFNWNDASDLTIYSAIMHSKDHLVSVGYKPAGEVNVEQRLTKINIHDNKWSSVKTQVIQLILQEEKALRPKLKAEDVEVWKENKLPVIDVRIDNFNTIKLLRNNPLIRYVEPMSYEPEDYDAALHEQLEKSLSGGSGCGDYVGENLQEGDDYVSILPGAKQSWNYTYHNIPNAWNVSTGTGMKIMVIDTGVSPDQDNMNSDFNQGYSSGRTIQKIVTLPNANNANDDCGHGTAMSSTAAAPRCIDGNSCGIAYNSNLVVCKAATDVVIEGSEIKGVSDGYTYAADDPTIKIISLSLGRVTGSSQIKDAIQYAYDKGKLMFCAGGTSTIFTSWYGVIFPATLPTVQAITGVKNTSNLVACGDCHKGKQIDFVIVMEKTSDKGSPICNAITGDVPSTVGGSSVATSSSAGIAALVWSAHPTETRDQILQRLTTTASSYPTKNKNYGYGKLNAYAAIVQ